MDSEHEITALQVTKLGKRPLLLRKRQFSRKQSGDRCNEDIRAIQVLTLGFGLSSQREFGCSLGSGLRVTLDYDEDESTCAVLSRAEMIDTPPHSHLTQELESLYIKGRRSSRNRYLFRA